MAHGNLEDLVIFRTAESYADRIHTLVRDWPAFEKQTAGSQIVRAADSIGANIAESYGRYQPNDRAHFLYIARGSAYETIYWIRRAQARSLFDEAQADRALAAFASLIQSLNAYIRHTKSKAKAKGPMFAGAGHAVAEAPASYRTETSTETAGTGDSPF